MALSQDGFAGRIQFNADEVGILVERCSRLVTLVNLLEFKPATTANVLQAFTDKLLGIAADTPEHDVRPRQGDEHAQEAL